jgi:hypothetical protein
MGMIRQDVEDIGGTQDGGRPLNGGRHGLESAGQAEVTILRAGVGIEDPTEQDLLEMEVIVLGGEVGEARDAGEGEPTIRRVEAEELLDESYRRLLGGQDVDGGEADVGVEKRLGHDRWARAERNEEGGVGHFSGWMLGRLENSANFSG